MERCRVCGSRAIDQVDYVEETLPGLGRQAIRVIITFCQACGWSDRTTSEAVPVPV